MREPTQEGHICFDSIYVRQAEEGNPEGGSGSVVVGGGWGTGITKGLKRSFWGGYTCSRLGSWWWLRNSENLLGISGSYTEMSARVDFIVCEQSC